MESPIYSRIERESAIFAQKNFLESEANLLKALQHMQNYKVLRKKELMLKSRLKKLTKEIQKEVNQVLKSVPKTSGIKKIEQEYKERKSKKDKAESMVGLNIKTELENIQKRLQELG